MRSTITINLKAPDYRRLVKTEAPNYIYRKTTAVQALKLARQSMAEQGLNITETVNENGHTVLTGVK